jgi:peptide/nickel transport system permease protein
MSELLPELSPDVELLGTDPALVAPVTIAARARQKRFGIGFWIAVAWLVVLSLLAIFAGLLPFVKDPDFPYADALRSGPSLSHWFGGDAIGRDMFSRVVYGARVSLGVGVTSIAIGMFVGGSLGMLAAYFRGKLDSVLSAATDVLLAFPSLIILLTLIAFLGQTVRNVILGLTIIAIPSLFRVARAATLRFADREFVVAARALGAGHRRIIVREILPNVVPALASYALLSVAVVVVAEGALSFLGLSVAAPTPTWGNLINEGRSLLDESPHVALIPCAVMFITLLALNHVGDRLRSGFDIRESGLS